MADTMMEECMHNSSTYARVCTQVVVNISPQLTRTIYLINNTSFVCRLMKAHVAKTSCSQLALIESAMNMLKIKLLDFIEYYSFELILSLASIATEDNIATRVHVGIP